jgi:hypothetical protein
MPSGCRESWRPSATPPRFRTWISAQATATRVRINDVPDDPPRAQSIDLDNLDPEYGAAYLHHLGVEGTEEELREASKAYGNHALALTLLGTYLADFCDKDVRRRIEIPKLMVDEVRAGAHARHVMAAYARMFEGKPELDILRALAYFDRPAEPAALALAGAASDAGSQVQGRAQAAPLRAPDPDEGPSRPARLPPADPRTLRCRNAKDSARCLPRRPLAAV